MANTIGEKELRTNWPFTSGLTNGSTKTWDRQMNLVPTEKNLVPQRNRVGL